MSDELERLRQEVARLRTSLEHAQTAQAANYYFSPASVHGFTRLESIPTNGLAPETVKAIIENNHVLDFNQKLNTSSYVNVEFEAEEEAVALMDLRVNSPIKRCTLNPSKCMTQWSICWPTFGIAQSQTTLTNMGSTRGLVRWVPRKPVSWLVWLGNLGGALGMQSGMASVPKKLAESAKPSDIIMLSSCLGKTVQIYGH